MVRLSVEHLRQFEIDGFLVIEDCAHPSAPPKARQLREFDVSGI